LNDEAGTDWRSVTVFQALSFVSEVTRLLSAIEGGDPHAASQLLPLVYDELRRLAAQKMAQERPEHTLQATALVHEAYLRLVASARGVASVRRDQHFDNRRHFFAAAAEAMRRILVESARRKHGPRQGGSRQRVDAALDAFVADGPSVDVLALDEALSRLAQEAPARAELVKLRYFAGLTMPEAADALGISLATAERYWTYARTWLYAELRDDEIENP
jgi:RNA polymerase sigma factor (TIGR02999 family)